MKLFDMAWLSHVFSWVMQSPQAQEAVRQAVPAFLGFGTGDEAGFGEAYTKLPANEDREAIDQLLSSMEKWEQNRIRQVIGKMTVEETVTETVFTPGGGKKETRTRKDLRVEFLKVLAEQVRAVGVNAVRQALANKGIIITDPMVRRAYQLALQGVEKAGDWIKTGQVFPPISKWVWITLVIIMVVMLLIGGVWLSD